MKLYTANSPNSLKVGLALAELGLEYETARVVLARGEHQTEAFERINPHQKVPVLEVDGVHLAESGAIVQYLGRTRGGDHWPKEPLVDALASRWLFFESAHLSAGCGALWWSDVLSPRRGVDPVPAPRIDAARSQLERALGVLEEQLAARDAILVGGFTLADCVLGTAVSMLVDTRVSLSAGWPNVAAYGARLRERASWATAEGGRCLHWKD